MQNKDEQLIKDFKKNLQGTAAQQKLALEHYENLRDTATFSAFQEFEALTPIFVDFKLTEAVKKTEYLARPILQAKDLFGVDNISMNNALNSLSTAIYNTSTKSENIASGVFNDLKETQRYQKLQGALGDFITIDSQMQNIQDMMIKSALEGQRSKVINNMTTLTMVVDTEAPTASAHTVLKYQNSSGQLFFAKGKDTSLTNSRLYNKNSGGLDEHIREYFGSQFIKEMDIKAPTITLKVDRNGQFEKMVSEGVTGGIELGKKIGAPNGMKKMLMPLVGNKAAVKGVQSNAEKLFKDNPDLKKELIELHAISLLMGNICVHVNNIMLVTDPNTQKLRPVPIDFGLSGMTMDAIKTARYDHNTLRHADFNTLFSDKEYAEVLSDVVKKFSGKRQEIEGWLLYNCTALGVTKDQLTRLSSNISSNLQQANAFIQRQMQIQGKHWVSDITERQSEQSKLSSVKSL